MYASQRYHDLRPKIAFCRIVKTIFTQQQNSPPKCASFVLQNVSSTMVLQQIHSMFNNKDTESPEHLFRRFLLNDLGDPIWSLGFLNRESIGMQLITLSILENIAFDCVKL